MKIRHRVDINYERQAEWTRNDMEKTTIRPLFIFILARDLCVFSFGPLSTLLLKLKGFDDCLLPIRNNRSNRVASKFMSQEIESCPFHTPFADVRFYLVGGLTTERVGLAGWSGLDGV